MKQPLAGSRARFIATYLVIRARLQAEGKLPSHTDNAQQGAEPAATAAR